MIVTASTKDVLFKMTDINNPQRYVCFYVRANEQATVSIQDGTYELRYCSGDTWYGMEHYFGTKTSYYKSDGIAEFTTSYNGGYISYSQVTYTLYSYFGGNTSSQEISQGEF